MTLIENNALNLMIFFIVVSFAIFVYNLSFELIFRNRRCINYATYPFFIKMYNLQTNLYNLSALAGVILFSFILFAMFIGSRVVRIYLFTIIPIDASMAVFIYYELTRSKYNNSKLNIFNAYYNEVANIEKSKNRLFTKINTIEEEFEREIKIYTNAFEKFNSQYPNQREKDRLYALVEEKRQVFIQNKNELINYNTTIIGQFNDSLREYVIQGIQPTFEIEEFTHIDVGEMKSFVEFICGEFRDYIKDKSYILITNGTIKNGEKIVELLNIAKELNIQYSGKEILDILIYCSQKVQNKSLVAASLLNQHYLSNDMLYGTVLDRDWSWCFSQDALAGFTIKDLIHLYQLIIEKNARQCCSKLLSFSSINQEDIIDRVLTNTLENNACVQMMRFHKIILNNNQVFDEEVNMYENMAYSIKLFNSSSNPPISNDWINQICMENSFYSNKDEIAKMYQKDAEVIIKKTPHINDILLCFYEGELSKNKYVDSNNLLNFYMDNLKTLNISTIIYLNILLSAVILKYDTLRSHKKLAIDSIKDSELYTKLDLKLENAEECGKRIIKSLIKNHLDIIIPIVNRTEKERQSLDKLINIR